MLAWVNGELVPEERAQVSVLDRGFLFGDGVYELVRYFDGHGVALDLHVAQQLLQVPAIAREEPLADLLVTQLHICICISKHLSKLICNF